MTVFEIIAVILTFAAAGGYLNHRFIGLPSTIGHMAFALLLSMLAVGAGKLGWLDIDGIKAVIGQIDFSKILLHGMLSFLLFAGALHIDFSDLRSVKWPVGILATLGVILATCITGLLTWAAAGWIGADLPFVDALLFGALIAPTDPIAVLSILKQSDVSRNLYVKIGGESLFNDGVGVVVFIAILGAASNPAGVNIGQFFTIFFYQSLGGLALGSLLGWIVYRMMRAIDEYKIEVLMTLALASGGYALAEIIHVSGPLAMVAAGLVIGNTARQFGMTDGTRKRLDTFWELIDDILNAALFLLIGLEILIIPLTRPAVLLGLLAIAAVLFARLVSVGLPIGLMRIWQRFEHGTIRLLTWGGLRGGLSIAMALSLPPSPEKYIILTMTYIVVLFSILVQGLTFGPFVRLLVKDVLSPRRLL